MHYFKGEVMIFVKRDQDFWSTPGYFFDEAKINSTKTKTLITRISN